MSLLFVSFSSETENLPQRFHFNEVFQQYMPFDSASPKLIICYQTEILDKLSCMAGHFINEICGSLKQTTRLINLYNKALLFIGDPFYYLHVVVHVQFSLDLKLPANIFLYRKLNFRSCFPINHADFIYKKNKQTKKKT